MIWKMKYINRNHIELEFIIIYLLQFIVYTFLFRCRIEGFGVDRYFKIPVWLPKFSGFVSGRRHDVTVIGSSQSSDVQYVSVKDGAQFVGHHVWNETITNYFFQSLIDVVKN